MMSAYALKPQFTDRNGYNQWRKEWKMVYKHLSVKIKNMKKETVKLQKESTKSKIVFCDNGLAAIAEPSNNLKEKASYKQSSLHYERVMAYKMMSLLEEAKLRMKRIYEMEKQIKVQFEKFPVEISDCRTIDFHFNKGATEFQQLPMWVVKCRGESWYINHFSSENVSWTTRELPDAPSTKGMIRFKNCSINIDKEGHAVVSQEK